MRAYSDGFLELCRHAQDGFVDLLDGVETVAIVQGVMMKRCHYLRRIDLEFSIRFSSDNVLRGGDART